MFDEIDDYLITHPEDYPKEAYKVGCYSSVAYVLALLVGMMLCVLFAGCTTTEYVNVPELHEVHHHHTDSIKQTDSVTMEKETIVMQLDSVAMAQYGIQLKSAERAWLVKTAELERRLQQLIVNHTDTVHEVDSVAVPYPVEVVKEVEKELTWWQRIKMGAGVMFMGVIIIICLIGLLKYHFHG